MTVYVDNARLPYGRMRMCHMIADSRAELIGMVIWIGVPTRWIQSAGRWQEHFDICLAKRKLAVLFGAVEVSTREIARRMRLRK